jgi:hypothetical protein
VHVLPTAGRTRLAVRRYHGLAFSADGLRVELDIDAVDKRDADNQFFDHLAALGVFPVRWTVSPVTGAAVGENVDTEPTGNATLDNPAVPGPVQVREATRQARKAARSAQQQHRQFMRRALLVAVILSLGVSFGAISLARALWGGA